MVELSFNYLGAKTVILQTIPISNNIDTLNELIVANRLIWKFSKEFEQTPTRRLLVMDIGALSIFMFLANSMDIGIIEKNEGEELQSKLMNAKDSNEFLNISSLLHDAFNYTIPFYRPNGSIMPGFVRKIGHACGDIECKQKSALTKDGVHWCMDKTAGRINAGLACLLQCGIMDENVHNQGSVQTCMNQCNHKYMSLVPIPWKS